MVTYRLRKVHLVLPFIFDKNLGTDNSLVIVVSPLVSLMVDQVRSLRSRSASVMFCTTLLNTEEVFNPWSNALRCFATVGPKFATASLASTAA